LQQKKFQILLQAIQKDFTREVVEVLAVCWVSRKGRRGGIWNLTFFYYCIFSKKRSFSEFRKGKNKFYQFWLPWKFLWLPMEKSTIVPPWKKSLQRPWQCA